MTAARILSGLILLGTIPLVTQAVSAGQSEKVGDPVRGRAILEGKGNCLSCHRVADQGSHLSPDLSAIGTERTVSALLKAVIDPAPDVQPQNRLYRIITKDGTTITGRLLNQDPYSVQMLDSKNRLLALSKADLRGYDFTATPPMPSYRDKLTTAEQDDLLAYLTSLKGIIKQ